MSESTSKAGAKSVQVALTGYDLINVSRLNKGTAFSEHERDLFEAGGAKTFFFRWVLRDQAQSPEAILRAARSSFHHL